MENSRDPHAPHDPSASPPNEMRRIYEDLKSLQAIFAKSERSRTVHADEIRAMQEHMAEFGSRMEDLEAQNNQPAPQIMQEMINLLKEMEEIRDQLMKYKDEVTRAPKCTVTKAFPFSKLAVRRPVLVGRRELLASIESLLAAQSCTIVLYGEGGVGKTSILKESLCTRRVHSPFIFWLDGENMESLCESVRAIAQQLLLTKAVGVRDYDDVELIVLDWLNSHPTWLLAIDNVDTVSVVYDKKRESSLLPKLLYMVADPQLAPEHANPTPRRGIILTSRVGPGPWNTLDYIIPHNCIEVSGLGVEDSSLLLFALGNDPDPEVLKSGWTEEAVRRRFAEMRSSLDPAKRNQVEVIKELASSEHLGGQPLSLVGAAGFIRTRQHEHRPGFAECKAEIQQIKARPFLLGLKALEAKLHCVELVYILSFLNPDCVSVSFLVEVCDSFDKGLDLCAYLGLKNSILPPRDVRAVRFREALADICSAGLAQTSTEGDIVSMHRLVQSDCRTVLHEDPVLRKTKLAAIESSCILAITEMLSRTSDEYDIAFQPASEASREVLAHCNSFCLLDQAILVPILKDESAHSLARDLANMLFHYKNHCVKQLLYREGLYVFERMEVIYTSNHIPEDFLCSGILRLCIGTMYQHLGNSFSLETADQALANAVSLVPYDPPDPYTLSMLAAAKFQQGLVFLKLRNFEEALGCLNDAFAKESLLRNKFALAQIYAARGKVFFAQESYTVALNEFRDAERLYQQLFQATPHALVAITCYNFGVVYFEQRDNLSARQYYIKALQMKEKVFGVNRPELIPECLSLGDVERDMNNLLEAAKHYRRACCLMQEFEPRNPHFPEIRGLVLEIFEFLAVSQPLDLSSLLQPMEFVSLCFEATDPSFPGLQLRWLRFEGELLSSSSSVA